MQCIVHDCWVCVARKIAHREDAGRIASIDVGQRAIPLQLHLVPAVVVRQHLQRPICCLRDGGPLPLCQVRHSTHHPAHIHIHLAACRWHSAKNCMHGQHSQGMSIPLGSAKFTFSPKPPGHVSGQPKIASCFRHWAYSWVKVSGLTCLPGSQTPASPCLPGWWQGRLRPAAAAASC